MALHHTSRTSAAYRIVNGLRRWGDYSRRNPLREGRIENNLESLSEQPERQAGSDGDRVARRHMYALDNWVAGFDSRLEVILRFEISLIGQVINRKIEVYPAAQPLVDTQSAVSHSLRALRQMRLVRFRREGKITYYALDDDHIAQLLGEGFRHVEELL